MARRFNTRAYRFRTQVARVMSMLKLGASLKGNTKAAADVD
jgi:hypothetical protein